MEVARGWYHAHGDPAGTVRLWDGTTWVGFPVADPRLQDSHDAPRVRPFEPVPGQVRLAPLAIAAQLSVLTLIGVYLFRMFVAVRERAYRKTVLDGRLLDIDLTEDRLTALIFLQAILWFVGILLMLLFGSIWMWRAWQNMKLWHKPLLRGRLLSRYSPLNILLELQTHSPPPHRAGVLNPVIAWAWWAMFAGVGAVERAVERGSHGDDGTAVTLLAIRIGLMGLTVVSFVLGLILIQQITNEQDRRMTPTQAQLRLLNEEAALKASLQNDPNRGHMVIEAQPGSSAMHQPPGG